MEPPPPVTRRLLLRRFAAAAPVCATFVLPRETFAAIAARYPTPPGAEPQHPPLFTLPRRPLQEIDPALRSHHLAPASHAGSQPPHRAHRHGEPQARSEPRPPLPLVMLDPGHGGKDPGAIGCSGTYEKQVALAAAQELKRQLEASGRYRVALTRTRDVFVPLDDRVEAAERAGATLFVSMHADALADHSVRGASVYTLAETPSDLQTAHLAQRENSADRFIGRRHGRGVSPEVERVLANLVRRETMAGSLRMARGLVGSLESSLPMLPNPERHAGFAVLKAADIPSVLVEMGFMSNPRDEAALRRADHRRLVAEAMRRAVDAYFAGIGHMA